MAAVVKPWALKLWKLSWGTVQIRVAPTSILPHQGEEGGTWRSPLEVYTTSLSTQVLP